MFCFCKEGVLCVQLLLRFKYAAYPAIQTTVACLRCRPNHLLFTHQIYHFAAIHGICPRSGVLQTQKLKTYLLRTLRSKILHFKLGTGPHIVMHAAHIARDIFLANLYPSGPFTCIFSKTSPEFFLCWLWLTPVPVWARRLKQATLRIVTDN